MRRLYRSQITEGDRAGLLGLETEPARIRRTQAAKIVAKIAAHTGEIGDSDFARGIVEVAQSERYAKLERQ